MLARSDSWTPTGCVEFLQRLIRTPSLPGEEAALADLVQEEMRRLKFDEVRVDAAGNVIGVIRGAGDAPSVMFNTHLDHVDVGDRARWPYPPYGGELHEGRVFGRGAVDIKGPLAAQVHGLGRLLAGGTRPPGDVYVTAVVQEEIGGFGARHLASHLHPALVIVGEPSRNQLRRGHRGRTELEVHITGRSAHASVPERGRNPLQVAARLIGRLQEATMRQDASLGRSTVAPTMIRTDQTSPNVIPAEAWLICDWRSVPGETSEEVLERLQEMARDCRSEGTQTEVRIRSSRSRAYTGLESEWPTHHPAFLLPADHPALRAAERILHEATGDHPRTGVWQFATDGGHFAAAGQTVVGFGPGDEFLAHTVDESIEIEALETAIEVNFALARDWAAAVQELRLAAEARGPGSNRSDAGRDQRSSN